jgi:hypothetical protein
MIVEQLRKTNSSINVFTVDSLLYAMQTIEKSPFPMIQRLLIDEFSFIDKVKITNLVNSLENSGRLYPNFYILGVGTHG